MQIHSLGLEIICYYESGLSNSQCVAYAYVMKLIIIFDKITFIIVEKIKV